MPEIDFTPRLMPLPPVRQLYTAASKSDPGVTHWVIVYEGGTIDCTCTGWKMQRKCWHVTQAAELNEIEMDEFDVSLD